jgi:hypothetical protein
VPVDCLFKCLYIYIYIYIYMKETKPKYYFLIDLYRHFVGEDRDSLSLKELQNLNLPLLLFITCIGGIVTDLCLKYCGHLQHIIYERILWSLTFEPYFYIFTPFLASHPWHCIGHLNKACL